MITKSYTLRGDPTRIVYPDGTHEFFKYDTEGSLHRSSNRDGRVTVYEYDYLGRSIFEEVMIANGKGGTSYYGRRDRKFDGFKCFYEKDINQEKQFKYSFTGQLNELIEFGEGLLATSPDTRKTEFFYDSLGRINTKKIWYGVGPKDYSIERFQYDLASNITEKRTKMPMAIFFCKNFSYMICKIVALKSMELKMAERKLS